ncbi:Hypothetical protein LUCI_2265 [Lucifera butyrica]|uniref:Uncharacterized protein n=1 Tax=Lucifera butyrica TaxID=1351585 RepID=A0A498R6P2_9FIRM|nr:hypothetical protein [Lucifera butyrica]VBB07021.1 Hypothetical protein LUCI_2265 [Lucifera butyrica]
MSIKNAFKNPRQAPVVSILPRQLNTSYSVLLQVLPAIRHGLKEINATDPQHALTEVALMSYLIGLGFDYRTAKVIVESWESDEQLVCDGILTSS